MPLPLSLTKIGRAPLHYACLSFRGLGVEAFWILLYATIEVCVVLKRRRYLQERGPLDEGEDCKTDPDNG